MTQRCWDLGRDHHTKNYGVFLYVLITFSSNCSVSVRRLQQKFELLYLTYSPVYNIDLSVCTFVSGSNYMHCFIRVVMPYLCLLFVLLISTILYTRGGKKIHTVQFTD